MSLDENMLNIWMRPEFMFMIAVHKNHVPFLSKIYISS